MPETTLRYRGCGCPIPPMRVTDAEVAERIAKHLVCPTHGRRPALTLPQARPMTARRDRALAEVFAGAE